VLQALRSSGEYIEQRRLAAGLKVRSHGLADRHRQPGADQARSPAASRTSQRREGGARDSGDLRHGAPGELRKYRWSFALKRTTLPPWPTRRPGASLCLPAAVRLRVAGAGQRRRMSVPSLSDYVNEGDNSAVGHRVRRQQPFARADRPRRAAEDPLRPRRTDEAFNSMPLFVMPSLRRGWPTTAASRSRRANTKKDAAKRIRPQHPERGQRPARSRSRRRPIADDSLDHVAALRAAATAMWQPREGASP
jgi:hypothetical protein